MEAIALNYGNTANQAKKPSRSGCFKCGEEGHISRNCTNSGNKKSTGCFKCGQDGHMARDCTGGVSGKPRSGCFNCGKEGHISKDCTEEKKGPDDENTKSNDELPKEIILKADYSCFCTVCNCSLSRIKDAIQHATGKRHKKSCVIKEGTEKKGTKRTAPAESEDNTKKAKTEENPEDDEAKKMLSKVFDETFHGGVVALRDNYYCKVCRCMIGNNRKNVNQHKEGKSHKVALEKFKQSLLSGTIGDDIPVEDPNQPFEGDGYIEKTKNAKRKTTYYCKLCDFRTKERDVITEHMREEKHQENIRIVKEKEMMAQKGGYLEAPFGNYDRFQHDDYHRGGAERGMHPEEYYRQLNMFGPQRPFDGEPHFNRQEPPFHGGYQDVWDHRFENFMPNQDNRLHPSMLDARMDPESLAMPQMRGDQHADSFFPHPQQGPIPFMPQPQQTPVPFMPQLQPAPVPLMPPPAPVPFMPQPQHNQVPTLPQSQQDAPQTPAQKTEPNEQNQVTSSSIDLPGFIANENDAEVVIDVISSLLETYLKYRIQALPGSFMKLLRKSSKSEESITRINKLSTGKTAKQIFINVQNQKSKGQSASTPDDKRSSNLFERRSDGENRSSKAAEDENIRNPPVDSEAYSSYESPKTTNETGDSYDRRSYIEDQLKKAIATSMMAGPNEDNSSRKAKQIESSIVDLFKHYRASINADKKTESSVADLSKQYRGSNDQEKPPQNARQNEPFITDFSKRYTSSSNDNISSRNARQNEHSINDLFVRYRSSNKEIGSPKNIRKNESSVTGSLQPYRNPSNEDRRIRQAEPSNIDFSTRYRGSRGFRKEDASTRSLHQNPGSVLDLLKKYRSSSTYSHS